MGRACAQLGISDDGFEMRFHLEEEAQDPIEFGSHILGSTATGDFPSIEADGVRINVSDIHLDLLTARKDIPRWIDDMSGRYGENC